MASSPIEIASSHFGCVLRDHNQRIIRGRNIDREREGNQAAAAAALRKNLEEFVRDHFPTCIGLSTTTNSENVSSDENSQPGSEDNNNNNNHQRDYWGFNEGRRNNQSFRPIVTNANKRRQQQQETLSTESSPTTARTWQSGRIFDRWSTRHQSGDDNDMVNSNERRRRQTNEAELQALSNSQPVSARASTFMRETSPSASDSSVDVPKLKASSLVQMWKEFEAESTTVPTGNNQSQSAATTTTTTTTTKGGGGGACSSLNSNPAISTSTGRNNSNSTNNSNIEDSYVEDPSVGSSGSNDETYEAVVVVTEDSFPDWESDQTVVSCSLSASQGQFSDTADSERVVRVADIIRRLTSASQPQSPATSVTDEVDRDQSVMSESLPRDHSLSDQSINGGNTPRVRGRQAFKDLLIQMEKERQRELTGLVERHAVSKFSHRGRIQSLLRLRFLQRGAAAEGQQNSTSELNQLQRRTTIFRLREIFSPSVERDGTAVSSREDDVRSPRQFSNDTPDSVQTGGLLNQEVRPHQKDIATLEHNCPREQNTMHTINEQLHEEASQSSDVTWEGPSSGVAQNNWREPVNSTDSSHDWEGEVITAEELAQQYVGGSTDSLEGVVAHNNWRKPENAASRWEGEVIITRKHLGRSTDGWEGVGKLDWQVPVTTAAGSSDSEGEVITAEEPIHETGQHVEESMDRWEGALVTEEPEHPNTQKSVEPVSGARQHDVSRPQSDWEGRRKAWYNDMLENNSDNDEVRALFERRTVSTFLSSERRERMDQMIFSFVRRQRHETTTEYSEEEENQENPIEEEHHYTEVSDDTDQVTYTSLQLPLPPQLRSLNQYEHNEVSDVSDHAASTLLQIPQSSQSDNEDSRQSSPFLRQSLEMELIYDLRGYMAQLHHEMTELRKSVQSCMGMQVQLQNSIKEEVSAAVCNSIRGGETNKFFNRQNSTRKNNCCICDEMQVDSLLYRCGHMCTCFKCAQELQWCNGRCPICRAPIVDVVRAYDT